MSLKLFIPYQGADARGSLTILVAKLLLSKNEYTENGFPSPGGLSITI